MSKLKNVVFCLLCKSALVKSPSGQPLTVQYMFYDVEDGEHVVCQDSEYNCRMLCKAYCVDCDC